MNKLDEDKLNLVAQALGSELLEELVFVGGVTTSIYIESEVAARTTPTEDVDLIANITSKLEFAAFEKRVGKRGFKRNLSEGGPLCRFYCQDIVVDFMPLNEKILGFSNRWYQDGFNTAELISLPFGQIKILSLPYFLATKCEAFQNRGKKDFLWASKDLEDLVVVMSGRKNLRKDLANLPPDVAVFIKATAQELLSDPTFREAATAALNDFGTRVAAEMAKELENSLNRFLGVT